MKKCTAGMLSKIVVTLLFAVFFLPMTGLFLYLAVFDPALSHEGRLLFFAGAILFGGLVVFAAYRALYLGIGWGAETDRHHNSRGFQTERGADFWAV